MIEFKIFNKGKIFIQCIRHLVAVHHPETFWDWLQLFKQFDLKT